MSTITDKTLLKRSTAGRDDLANADGNVFYDLTNNEIQFLDVTEVPTVNGQPNALKREGAELGGLTGEVFNDFNYDERKASEDLQFFFASFDGGLREVGQYFTTYGWSFAGDDETGDVKMLRSTGVEYRDASGVAQKIFFCPESLPNITPTTQATFQVEQGGTSFDFFFKGNVNEPVKVLDVAAGLDKRSYFAIEVATAGSIFSKVDYTKGTGGYSTLIGAGQTADSNLESLIEVDGNGNIVFTNAVPDLTSSDFIITEEINNDFKEGEGNFFLTFDNTTTQYPVNVIAAALQKLKLSGTTITFSLDDASTINVDASKIGNFFEYENGKFKFSNPLYGYENLLPSGRTVSPSFFIKGVLTSEDQRVIFTEDDGSTRTYEFFPGVRIDFGTITGEDAEAYYRIMPFGREGDADFENVGAITAKDSNNVTLAGTIDGNRYLEYKTTDTGEFIIIASGVDVLKSNNARFTLDGVSALTTVVCQLTRRTA